MDITADAQSGAGTKAVTECFEQAKRFKELLDKLNEAEGSYVRLRQKQKYDTAAQDYSDIPVDKILSCLSDAFDQAIVFYNSFVVAYKWIYKLRDDFMELAEAYQKLAKDFTQ